MSRDDKIKSLYSAIGGVYDGFVQEAADGTASRGKKTTRGVIIAIVAAALVVVLMLGSAFAKFISLAGDKHGGGRPDSDFSFEKSVISISADKKSVPADELDVYSGAAIYWTCDGGQTVYSSAITESQFNTYRDRLNVGSETVEDPKEEKIMVWIGDPYGNVSSPFLKQTNGNIAFGHLFDYSAEVIPSRECLEYITKLMA